MKNLMSVLLGLSLIIAVAAPSFAADDEKKTEKTEKKSKKKSKKKPADEAPKH